MDAGVEDVLAHRHPHVAAWSAPPTLLREKTAGQCQGIGEDENALAIIL